MQCSGVVQVPAVDDTREFQGDPHLGSSEEPIQTTGNLQEAVPPGVAVEPVEVGLGRDLAHAVTDLAGATVTGFVAAFAPVESKSGKRQHKFGVARERQVREYVRGQ